MGWDMERSGGWMYRMTSGINRRSRARRYELFLELMDPARDDTILDVGITDSTWRAANPLELSYPRPERITAVCYAEPHEFVRAFPEVQVVVADGRNLPFADDAFDIGFSNAVVEHVGDHEQQRRFVHEMVRTCRRTMIATPNAMFPVDPHTLLPFIHWLPRRVRHPILRWTGNGVWASEDMLNPLTARAFRSLFPDDVDVRIVRQRLLGLTSVLIAVVDRP
ncbi:MAG: methyltransferase domain-containing protein [Candidatus Limnocylindrales bacterium]